MFKNSYFRFGVNHSFVQDRVYQLFGEEKLDETPAYTLLNVGIGTDIMSRGRRMCSLYVNIDNLTDESYIDNMSRFRYVANEVNGAKSKYIYNMGRNVSVKVIVPLNFERHTSKKATKAEETTTSDKNDD